MPAVSEKQRRFFFATKGAAWVERHHFDNKGPLPMYANPNTNKQRLVNSLARKRK